MSLEEPETGAGPEAEPEEEAAQEDEAVQEQEEAPPRTRRCRVCSVEINVASARCPYCGTRQFKYPPLLGWRGLIVLVVAVAAAVLITRAIIDAENDTLRYDSYDSVNLAAFVPAGWTNLLLSAPHGTAMAGYVDPSSAADSVTARATLDSPGSPHSRMLALYDSLGSEPGVARGYHSSVTLPGDEVQWTVYYTLQGAFYAVFFSDACNGSVGMTLTLSSASATRLAEYALTLPWTTEPHCDGPAFSGRDRADASVPLAPR